MKWQDLKNVLQMVGFDRAVNTLISTLSRDWWDRKLKFSDIPVKESPSDVVSSTRLSNGERFRFVCGSSRIDLEIAFIKDNLARITWGNSDPSPINISSHPMGPSVELEHQVAAGEYSIRSKELSISVLPDGGIRGFQSSGKLLFEMLPPEFNNHGFMQTNLLKPTSRVYGLGERASPLNLRPGMYKLWNIQRSGNYGPGQDPLYLCIPVYMVIQEENCYLVFFENSYRGSIQIAESLEAQFGGGMHRYYVISGSPAEVIHGLTDLTGKPELPPLWALGYHQSKWGYKSAEQIRAVVSKFHENDLPLSAIHLDIDYMRDFRVFTIDPDRFPDFPGFASGLEDQGVKVVAIIDPGVKCERGFLIYDEGLKNSAFCEIPNGKLALGTVWPGRVVFPDFTSPSAREWWGNQYKTLIDSGVSGFWHDMNEPSSFNAWGEMRPTLAMQHKMEGKKTNHLEARNLYGLLMNQAGYEGVRKITPQKRPWFLSRSGWSGIQKYAWNWTGDIESSWAMLKQTIATIINLGLSGQPFSGSDVGGFGGTPSTELYLRWFQMSCWLPFFRTHSSFWTAPREPWTFEEPVLSFLRATLKLRYQLLPFIYTLAWEASQTGAPFVRPLFWNSPCEKEIINVEDEFLLGDAVLVAPVLEEQAVSRSVIFPEGGWYDFWDGTYFQGPLQVQISCRLADIPVFIKGGKILPLQQGSVLSFHLYAPKNIPGASLALELYSDAGDGYPSSPSDWRIDRFHILTKESQILISRTQEGEFPWPYRETNICLHGFKEDYMIVDGKQISIKGNQITSGLFRDLVLNLPE